ncbi:MAG: xylose isomerase [Blastopirellula sp.]|nr:MAG: xylose isomerase [Blastopirellula sp.]
MKSLARRHFLQTCGTAAIASITAPAFAIDRFERINPRIKGIALSAYSLKPHMQWWKGEQTDGTLDILGFLDYCAKLGIDGAELTSYFFPKPLDRTYINQVKRRAHLLGIDITGGAIGNNFSHAPNSDLAAEEVKYFRSWIDHFADLGAPVVRVFASRGNVKAGTEDQVIANVIANLQQALPYAEKRGVMLGLENHDIMKNVNYLLEVIDAIDSPWLGVTWDSANLTATPDPYAELARIAPHAVTAQLKVMTQVNGKPSSADFTRMLKILHDAKYGGYVVLEYEEKEEPYNAIPEFVNNVRQTLATMN